MTRQSKSRGSAKRLHLAALDATVATASVLEGATSVNGECRIRLTTFANVI